MLDSSSRWDAPATYRAGVLLAVALALLLWIPFRHFTVDDAYIAYRAARNFGRGLGPVMNPGERVEGVSNLPWTLWLGAWSALGAAPHRVAPWMSLVCGLACVPLAARVVTRATCDRRAGVAAAFLCAAGLPLAIWSASGMETAAYALVLLWFVERAVAAARDGAGWGRAGLVGGALATLRPEALLLAAAGGAAALWRTPERRGAATRFVAGVAAVLVPLVALRLAYFGDWLPNPARAKAPEGIAALGPGSLYVAKLVLSFPLAFVALLPLARRAGAAPAAAIGVAVVVAQLVFAVLAGGDHFAGYRFAAPVWPLLACAMAWGLVAAPASVPRRGGVVGLVCAAIGVALCAWPEIALPWALRVVRLQRLHLEPAAHAARLVAELRHFGVVALAVATWVAVRQRARATTTGGGLAACVALLACTLAPAWFDPQIRLCVQADAASRTGRPVGEWLAAHLPPDALVATNAAGSVPYWSDRPALDMLGLADRHIARSRPDRRQWVGHERGDGDYVLGRRPALVIFGGPEGAVLPWPFPGDRQLAANPEFGRLYAPRRVALADFDFTFWGRRDLALPGEPLAP